MFPIVFGQDYDRDWHGSEPDPDPEDSDEQPYWNEEQATEDYYNNK